MGLTGVSTRRLSLCIRLMATKRAGLRSEREGAAEESDACIGVDLDLDHNVVRAERAVEDAVGLLMDGFAGGKEIRRCLLAILAAMAFAEVGDQNVGQQLAVDLIAHLSRQVEEGLLVFVEGRGHGGWCCVVYSGELRSGRCGLRRRRTLPRDACHDEAVLSELYR